MKLIQCSRGSLTPMVLFGLMGMGLVAASLLFYSRSVTREIHGAEKYMAEKKIIMERMNLFVAEFLQDSTPEADSPRDLEGMGGFVQRLEGRFEFEFSQGTTLVAEEVSSRLNPNFDSMDLWRSCFLVERCSSYTALALWEEDRIVTGFLEDPEDFHWIIYPQDWRCFYSVYSPLVLQGGEKKIIEVYLKGNLWNQADIDAFWGNIEDLINAGGISQEELSHVVSLSGGAPALQIEPGWNVNFMDPQLLTAMAEYPWGGSGITNPSDVVYQLLKERRVGEVNEADLGQILKPGFDRGREAFLKRFGVRSWFWKITVRRENLGMEFILRRIPSGPVEADHTALEPAMQVVSERILQ